MRNLLIVLAISLGACAAPALTSQREQALCQLDPQTGRCKTGLDENDVQSVTEHYIATNYQEAVYQSMRELRTVQGGGSLTGIPACQPCPPPPSDLTDCAGCGGGGGGGGITTQNTVDPPCTLITF